MKVNLKCGSCHTIYDFEVGEPMLDDEMNIIFEHKSVCPKCGVVDNDLLSEKGQIQMTEWDLKDLDLDL